MSQTWKRTEAEEVRLRASMVRGTWLEDAAQAVIDQLGSARAERQVPISGATNLVRRHLQVTAVCYDYCAMYGLPDELRALCSDSSSLAWRRKLEQIGASPIPSGLVQGGGRGGLRQALEYLQTLEYSGVAVEWSTRSERPYVIACRPEDLLPSNITYSPDDPLSPVRIRWRRERSVDGQPRQVHDVWDLSDLEYPTFAVELGGEDVSRRCDDLRGAGDLSGDGYPWRYTHGRSSGRPYIPVVIYGAPGRVMAGVHITEAALDALVFRTALKSAMLDAGFPTREVRGLMTGAEADLQSGNPSSALSPGDVRVWVRRDEEDPGDHWQFGAAVDPESMYRVAQAQETDAANVLGVPLDLTRLGGEPFAHALEQRRSALSRWYDVLRAGDAILMRRIAATANRETGSSYPEGGYSGIYQDELREALVHDGAGGAEEE